MFPFREKLVVSVVGLEVERFDARARRLADLPLRDQARIEPLGEGRFVAIQIGEGTTYIEPFVDEFVLTRRPSIDLRALDGWFVLLQDVPHQLRLFDTGRPPLELGSCPVDGALVVALAADLPAHSPVVVAGGGPLVERIDPTTCARLAQFVVRTSEVRSVAVSRDGLWTAAGTTGGDVYLWDAGGRVGMMVSAHGDRVATLAFAPHGAWLASGSWDGRVRLYTLETLDHPAQLLVARIRHPGRWGEREARVD